MGAWLMSGREAATGIEVCFISQLYTLLRLLKASAEGVFVRQDVDVVKMRRASLLRFPVFFLNCL